MRKSSTFNLYVFETIGFTDIGFKQKQHADYKRREEALTRLTARLYSVVLDKDMLEILIAERYAINMEYEHLEGDFEISQKFKSSRLTMLEDILVHLRNCIKDVDLILKNPQKYADGIQEAYGQNRKIISPPTGDNVRKFVNTQSQRLGRLNQAFRSSQETLYFIARQDALKKLGGLYTQLQCKALRLEQKD